jgi:hypothetical protein
MLAARHEDARRNHDGSRADPNNDEGEGIAMKSKTRAEANGRLVVRTIDEHGVDAGAAALHHLGPSGTDRTQCRTQASEALTPGEAVPAGDRDLLVWQQLRWILSHGMWA